MRKTHQNNLVEPRLVRAYTYLFVSAADRMGAKTASLARFGNYEVRLIETNPCIDPPMWLELYARDTQSSIDSCCCHDLEEAVNAADRLISSARELNDELNRHLSVAPIAGAEHRSVDQANPKTESISP